MIRSRSRSLAAAVASLTVLLLAGCVGIPGSGPVEKGDAISTSDEIDIIFQPSGPGVDESQEDILNGFIRAALNPLNNFAVARSFLSKSFSDDWKPDAGVTIDQSGRSTQTVSETSIDLKVSPIATVDGDGEYVTVPAAAPVTRSYTFVQEGGQWRINTAPDGIVMLATEFAEVYNSYPLYFFDPSYERLVPDVRWFPRVASNTGTRIARALINGPSAWLGGAVVTAFPEGTGVTSVPVDAGLASVDLSGPVLDSSEATLERMQVQLRASLLALSGVSTVRLTVDSTEVPLATSGDAAPVTSPRVDSRALVLRSGQFGFFTGSSLTPIEGISDDVASLAATSIAFSDSVPGLQLAAVGTAAGVYAVAPSSTPGLVDDRPGLIEPSIDPDGFVWTVPRGSPLDVRVAAGGRTPSSFTATWDGASEIVSLDVSRDGARVLAFLTMDGVPRLVVASVIRDKDGTPTGLGEPVDLAEGPGTAVDATWVDSLSVASATLTASGDNAIVQQQIGGTTTQLADASDVVSLVGSNDVVGLRVLASDGTILQQSANTWQVRAADVALLATQY
ncbi:LpqB family beta-propeller domain-containing protein [Agreia sp. PsM10]|uniref:LpqB family beta-propeller domain-containing protein n=1 Tax=Agreia sp. PsM10 TaxID=3030533 RepID=UPI00263AB6B1|nr:LpqB family beta-propeller domain-containing protein [Agreia sp. PsM10]MDN4639333.1 LpqB family beta-propeller domain-containing protein [Agreia sp. PsM10]